MIPLNKNPGYTDVLPLAGVHSHCARVHSHEGYDVQAAEAGVLTGKLLLLLLG